MTPIPITFCLYTSTKGHFNKSTYRDTLDSFNEALSLSSYADRVAHIKVSPGEDNIAHDMKVNLQYRGFRVFMTEGAWSHGDSVNNSHQLGYLNDMLTVYGSDSLKTPYVLHIEDDFIIKSYSSSFIRQLKIALEMMDSKSDLMQVRICRFSNELERINGLYKKHGIDGKAYEVDKDHFRHNDLSLHPSVFRTRDIRAAVLLTLKTNIPKHVEMGMSYAFKLMSQSDVPFACLNPEVIRVGHIGCATEAERDDLSKPLIAT